MQTKLTQVLEIPLNLKTSARTVVSLRIVGNCQIRNLFIQKKKLKSFSELLSSTETATKMNLNWMNQTSEEAVYLEKLSNLLCTRGEKKCNNGPAQVLDHLYCGSRMDAHNLSLLRRLRITHVLNCAAGVGHDPNCVESPYKKDDQSGVLHYMELDALDYPGYPIIRTHYRCAKTFIDGAKASGGRALVHCELGVNRSAALCVAYSMEEEQMSLLRAVRQLQIDRPNILCNEGFRRQLIDFARERNLLHPRRTTFDQTVEGAADDGI